MLIKLSYTPFLTKYVDVLRNYDFLQILLIQFLCIQNMFEA